MWKLKKHCEFIKLPKIERMGLYGRMDLQSEGEWKIKGGIVKWSSLENKQYHSG